MITRRLHALHAKDQKLISLSLDSSESEGEKETIGVVPTTTTTKALYSNIIKPNSSLLDKSESECSWTGDSSLFTIGSNSPPIQQSKRRKQKRGSLDPASDTDESTSSKFLRSRASSEDSSLFSEYETSTLPKNKLFVGGLPLQLRAPQLIEIFSQFGKVQHAFVLKTKYGTSKVLLNYLTFTPLHRTILCR
jgi:RNA recognition motif-containing protein